MYLLIISMFHVEQNISNTLKKNILNQRWRHYLNKKRPISHNFVGYVLHSEWHLQQIRTT